jgi:hypothetical protein
VKFIGKLALTFSLLFATTVHAVPRLDIDVDTSTPGFQSDRIVAVGAIFDVAIHISGVSGLYSYDLGVAHNDMILDATGVTEGNFLSNIGLTFFSADDSTTPVNAASVLLGAPNGASGSGLLFTIQYTALMNGISSLEFVIADLVDDQFNQIDPLEIGGARIRVQDAALPSTLLLFSVGLGLIGLRRRNR